MKTEDDYEKYKNLLNKKGWNSKLTKINQNSKEVSITLNDINKIDSTIFLSIGSLKYNEKIIIVGINHPLKLYITDENGNEIPDNTKIELSKLNKFDGFRLTRFLYSEIKSKDCYLKYRIELYSSYKLCFSITNLNYNIPKENIKFEIMCDIWTRDEL